MSEDPRTPLPGAKEAAVLGYELWAHSGNRKGATYHKAGINLTVSVKENGTVEAELSAQVKLITLRSGTFSFPHKNFSLFEKQIKTIYDLGCKALGVEEDLSRL